MKIKEIRKLSVTAFCKACEENNWYTAGTGDEWKKLMQKLSDDFWDDKHMSTERLQELAEEVVANSRLHNGEGVAEVMWVLNGVCQFKFVEEE